MTDPHAHHDERTHQLANAAPAGVARDLAHEQHAHGKDTQREASHVGIAHVQGAREGGAHGAVAHNTHDTHNKHAGHSVDGFRRKFWLSLVLTAPPLIWGHMLQRALGYNAPIFPGSGAIPAVFGSLVFVYGGWVFLQGAARELRDRAPGMMTLISLAITVAFGFSVAVTLGFPGMPLWEELASLVTIMLLGHWLEMRSIGQAQGALKELAKLLPDIATRFTASGTTEDVPASTLRDGDVVLVRPGLSVPADGVVRDGQSDINESMITGESRPVDKVVGAKVIAGTINGAGVLRIEVTATGDKTALAGIMRLVADAQRSRSRAQILADRAAFWLTWVALGSATVTLVVWLAVGASASEAIERFVTVLVIACPHALGLAVPLVVAISTTMGAQNGLLVRDRRGLEEARNLTTVVFDKTGTLTLGQHRVVDIAVVDGVSTEEALAIGAALERNSEHPVAHAIVSTADERGVPRYETTNFSYTAGRGVDGTVNGQKMSAGGPNLLHHLTVQPPPEILAMADTASARGQGTIYLVREATQVIAAFAVADAIRPESSEAIAQLHAAGIEVAMLTGDARAVADGVAKALGIDTVFAEVLPEQKSAKIRELQSQGKRVAMIGDGVNDAPALTQSDVAIAIGAGTDVAVEAGDIILVRSDPRDIARIVTLSRATYAKMVQNLWWAAGYNVVAIPLAAGVFARWGVNLTPAAAAVLMSASTIIVAINAQLLRRTKL